MLAVVFSAGGDVPREVLATLPVADITLAADGGAGLARRAGRTVDHLVGDQDSIDAATLTWLESSDSTIHRHPPHKDQTDLELALELAVREGADRVIVVGGHGGRLDHFAANLALLADRRWPNPLTWLAGADRVEIVRGTRTLTARPGAIVTVLATEPATGVSLDGLRWPLNDAVLAPGSTLGVSNVVSSSPFTVGVDRGSLMVVIPDQPI